jgi:hypothetical protein
VCQILQPGSDTSMGIAEAQRTWTPARKKFRYRRQGDWGTTCDERDGYGAEPCAQGRAAELERQLHTAESTAAQLGAEAAQCRQRAADAEAAAQAEALQHERRLAQQQVCPFVNVSLSGP